MRALAPRRFEQHEDHSGIGVCKTIAGIGGRGRNDPGGTSLIAKKATHEIVNRRARGVAVHCQGIAEIVAAHFVTQSENPAPG